MEAKPLVDSCAGNRVPYFAYGANMSSLVLNRRGISRGWTKNGEPAQVVDASMSLAFAHRSGFATLLETRTEKMNKKKSPQASSGPAWQWTQTSEAFVKNLAHRQPHGVLYYIERSDLSMLEKFEVGYRQSTLLVQPYGGGNPVEALVFVSRGELLLRRPVAPTSRYMNLLREGAKRNGLNTEYVAWLENVPTVSDSTSWDASEYNDTCVTRVAHIVAAGAVALGLTSIIWQSM